MADSEAPDKHDMMLAFGYATAREVALVDGELGAEETWDLGRRFPVSELTARGLVADGVPTARFGAAYNLAQARLRTLMTDAEKLEMAQALFEVCSADEHVDPREIAIIVRAMSALGVSQAQLATYVRARVRSGTHGS